MFGTRVKSTSLISPKNIRHNHSPIIQDSFFYGTINGDINEGNRQDYPFGFRGR